MGHALVDLEVEVDDGFLKSRQVEKGQRSLVSSVEKEKLHHALCPRPVHRCSGGSVANTVVGLARLGGSGGFIGKVGPDLDGDFFREDLGRVRVPLLCDPGESQTGTCTVMITQDAQRTMMTHLGVAEGLGCRDVDPAAISQARYLLVEGYLLPHEESLEATLSAISAAVENQVRVALTVSDPFVVEKCGDLLWKRIEGPVDLLIRNDVEGRILTGRDEAVAAAREIHRHSADVAITMGSAGSALLSGGECHRVQVVPVEAVDTTGAGDMYAAGLLFGLTRGWGWMKAGRLGSQLASKLISAMGSRLAEPLTEEEMIRLTAACEEGG